MRCEPEVLLLLLFLFKAFPVRSQFRFTLPPTETETEGSSSQPLFEDISGNPVETPRGLFHFSDTEQNVESKFRLPDLQEMDPLNIAQTLMSAAAKAQTRRKSLGGFNIPMPIGATPMNLQVSSDTHSDVSFSDNKENSTNPVITGHAKEAFETAKSVCLHSNIESCDEALDTYYRVKYGSSIMPSTSSEPAAELATMIVPGLRKKLDEIVSKREQEDEESQEESLPEVRRADLIHRYSLPPRLPSRSSSTAIKIRGFLDRIS